MRRFVLGTFLLAEIAGLLVYVAVDNADDVSRFEPDGAQFGDMLSQAYEDIAWADAVRRSMLAEGGPRIAAGDRQPGAIAAQSPGFSGNLPPSGAPLTAPLAAASGKVIPVLERDPGAVSGTGQNR